MVDHREIAFEDAIEHSLTTSGGYEKGDPALYDRTRALHPHIVLEFVQTTQPKPWKVLADYYGASAGDAFLGELVLALESRGTLDVIRHGPVSYTHLSNFAFDQQIQKLDKSNRLFKLVQKFSEVDLHPNVVSNLEMGRSFEELVRKFNEAANEEAGDHFTPREVIRLMVDLIFLPDNDLLRRKGAVRTLFDPAAGTGGMLSRCV